VVHRQPNECSFNLVFERREGLVNGKQALSIEHQQAIVRSFFNGPAEAQNP
jgi:hypothetical protein